MVLNNFVFKKYILLFVWKREILGFCTHQCYSFVYVGMHCLQWQVPTPCLPSAVSPPWLHRASFPSSSLHHLSNLFSLAGLIFLQVSELNQHTEIGVSLPSTHTRHTTPVSWSSSPVPSHGKTLGCSLRPLCWPGNGKQEQPVWDVVGSGSAVMSHSLNRIQLSRSLGSVFFSTCSSFYNC